jgi:SAM-dependent methyltransferase
MQNRLWFEDYFDEAYQQVYSRHLLSAGQNRAETNLCRRLLQVPRGALVLDIACGFGRHAKLLGKSGLRTVAVDLNRRYVSAACQGTPVLGAAGDMRALPLAADSCDGAILLFNSYGYFGARELWSVAQGSPGPVPTGQVWKLPRIFYERQLVAPDFGRPSAPPAPESANSTNPEELRQNTDRANIQVLEEAARVLKPGARLILELTNPAEVVAAVRETPRRHMIGRGFEMQEEYAYDSGTGVLHGRTSFILPHSTRHSEYWVRLYTLPELRRHFRTAGMRVLETYGSVEGESYSRSDSTSLWIVGQKNPVRPRNRKMRS